MLSPDLSRSWLFAPANNVQIVEKALASHADGVVLDLEDGIPAEYRSAAHDVIRGLREAISNRNCQVRISLDRDGYAMADADVAVEVGAKAIRLPKAASTGQLSELVKYLDEVDPHVSLSLFLTIESAAGLLRLRDLLAVSPRVRGVVFGEQDYLADLGAHDGGPLSDHARAVIAVTSRAAGLFPPMDGAYVDLEDRQGLEDACRRAKQFGFGGKSAIHPNQLETIHSVFSPSPEEARTARLQLEAFERAALRGDAVTTLDGRLIDAAIARRARAVIEMTRAEDRH